MGDSDERFTSPKEGGPPAADSGHDEGMADDKGLKTARRQGAGSGLRGLLGPTVKNWAERGYHIGLICALVSLPIFVPQMGMARAVMLVFLPLLAVAVAIRGAMYNPDLTVAVGSAAVTLLLLYMIIRPLTASPLNPVPVDPSLMLLPVAATVAPYMWPRPFTSTGLTAVLGQLVVLVAVGVGLLLGPLVAVVAGLVGLLVLNIIRGGGRLWLAHLRARVRSGIHVRVRANPATANSRGAVLKMKRADLRRGEAAEVATGAVLSALGPHWKVMHSRALPGTAADADHIVVGPPGVVLIDTKDWKGEVTVHYRRPTDDDDDQTRGRGETLQAVHRHTDGRVIEYGIGGYRDRLATLADTVFDEAMAIAQPLRLTYDDLRVVIVFTDRMIFNEPIHGQYGLLHVDLVHAADLVAHLNTFPNKMQFALGRNAIMRAQRKGITEEAVKDEVRRHYLDDLGAAIDWACPPKR